MFRKNKNKFIDRTKIKAQVERKEKIKLHFSRSRMIFYALVVFFVAATSYIIFFSSFLKIEKITISGIDELDYGKVIEQVQSSISGNYLKYIPKNNVVLVSKKDITNDLLATFKKLRSIEVKKTFPNEIEINLSERTSLLIFCKKEMINGSCYLMDERSVVYGEADLNSPEVTENNLVTVIDTSDKEISLGDGIFEEKDIQFMNDIKKQLSSIEGIEFDAIYSTPSRLSGEFRFTTKNGMMLYISSLMPLEETERILQVFLKKESEGQKREFEYIDLRTENKVYYKAKGAPVEQNEENKDGSKEGDKEEKKN